MKGGRFLLGKQARRAGASLALSALLAMSLVGCDAGLSGSGERVRLVITPVATPTQTPQAMPTVPPVTYIVRAGDTLWGIANLFGVEVDDIVRTNNIADPSSLAEGQALTIPGRSASPPSGSAQGTPTTGANETPAAGSSPSPGGQGTPGAATSPTMPPPDATPPQGPAIIEPTP